MDHCYVCGAGVDIEIVYESGRLGEVLGYRCPYCGFVSTLEDVEN